MEKKLKEVDSDARWLSCEIMRNEQRFSEAIELFDEELKLQNKELRTIRNQSVTKVTSDFTKKKSADLRKKNIYERILLLGCIITLIILFASITFLYRRKKRIIEDRMVRNITIAQSLKMEVETKNDIITSLSSKLNENTEQVKELKSIIEHGKTKNSELARKHVRELLSTHFNIIDLMCDNFFEWETTAKGKRDIHNAIMNIIDNIAYNDTLMTKIENIVNENDMDLLNRLRNAIPDINSTEIKIFTFFYLGFSARSISYLLKLKIRALYNKKSALKRRIQDSDLSNKDEFIGILENTKRIGFHANLSNLYMNIITK